VCLLGAGVLVARAFRTSDGKRQAKKRRARAIAEAEEHMRDPELLPPVRPEDLEESELAGTIKIHVEAPSGEIVSFRVKKRRLGTTYDELCAVIVQGVAQKALSLPQLQAMEMQYEDRDGDMLMLSRSSDVAELVAEAQALFVSRRAKKMPTRISAQGPRSLTETPGGVLVPLPSV